MVAAYMRPSACHAGRLVWLVRRRRPGELARAFRQGLAAPGLMQVIGALPAERRRALSDRAHPPGEPEPGVPDRRADRPLASAIRTARQQAGISQEQLARLIGVQQGAVSPVGARREPSGLHIAALLRVLPWLADLLDTQTTQAVRVAGHHPRQLTWAHPGLPRAVAAVLRPPLWEPSQR